MFSILADLPPYQRYTRLVPSYFLLRALLLFMLGTASIAAFVLHVSALTEGSFALILLLLYSAALLLANAYLVTWFPLKESYHFPHRTTHPFLAVTVVCSLTLAIGLLHESSNLNSNLNLLSFTLVLPACSAAGLSWNRAALLLLTSGIAAGWALMAEVGTAFVVMILLSQQVTLILFKSMIEEFRNRTVLDLKLAELEATQHLLEQSIVQSTRQAIARDLHDELGHLITQLHCAFQNQSFERKPEADTARTRTVQSLLLQLKHQVRAVALQLRQSSEFELHSTLQLLTDAINHPVIRLNLGNTPATCSTQVGETLFRICQEAITNCLRHSDATQMEISICFHRAEFKMSITDNGQLPQLVSSGTGLAGLSERIDLLRGTLTFANTSQGFTLNATLPVPHDTLFHSSD